MEGRKFKIPLQIPVLREKHGQGLGKRFGKGFEKKFQIKFQKRIRKSGHGSEIENNSSVAFDFKSPAHPFCTLPQAKSAQQISALIGGEIML
ncbi:MAG: hypothetical protein JSV42_02135 [Chloroflexota bacterium]|nr:MAG: hypothetical protein JSV42_02135 [Chloroflexota bacterium]